MHGADNNVRPARPFSDLGLPGRLAAALQARGLSHCTPLQSQLLPLILQGRDVVCEGPPHSGKTNAALIGGLARVNPPRRQVQAVIVASTELRANSLQRTATAMCKDTDISPVQHLLIAEPGRLLQMLAGRRHVATNSASILIVDDVDKLQNWHTQMILEIFQLLPSGVQVCMLASALPSGLHALAPLLRSDPAHIRAGGPNVPAMDAAFQRTPQPLSPRSVPFGAVVPQGSLSHAATTAFQRAPLPLSPNTVPFGASAPQDFGSHAPTRAQAFQRVPQPLSPTTLPFGASAPQHFGSQGSAESPRVARAAYSPPRPRIDQSLQPQALGIGRPLVRGGAHSPPPLRGGAHSPLPGGARSPLPGGARSPRGARSPLPGGARSPLPGARATLPGYSAPLLGGRPLQDRSGQPQIAFGSFPAASGVVSWPMGCKPLPVRRRVQSPIPSAVWPPRQSGDASVPVTSPSTSSRYTPPGSVVPAIHSSIAFSPQSNGVSLHSAAMPGSSDYKNRSAFIGDRALTACNGDPGSNIDGLPLMGNSAHPSFEASASSSAGPSFTLNLQDSRVITPSKEQLHTEFMALAGPELKLDKLGLRKLLSNVGRHVSGDQLCALIDKVDDDHNGWVDVDEFMKLESELLADKLLTPRLEDINSVTKSQMRKTIMNSSLVIASYFAVGTAYGVFRQQWSFTSAMYFTIVTLTTVGYGDFGFNLDGTKGQVLDGDYDRLLGGLFVFVGVTFIGTLAGIVLEDLSEKAEQRLRGLQQVPEGEAGEASAEDFRGPPSKTTLEPAPSEETLSSQGTKKKAIKPKGKMHRGTGAANTTSEKFELNMEIAKLYKQLYATFGRILVTLTAGTVVMPVLEGWSFADAFYWSCVTMTTVGYGDLHPTTDLSKWFSIVYIMFAFTLLATAISFIASLPFEVKRLRNVDKVLHQFGDSLDENELHALLNCKELRYMRNKNQLQIGKPDSISRSEFVLWLLMKQEKLDLHRDILRAMAVFDKLDEDASGTLEQADIDQLLDRLVSEKGSPTASRSIANSSTSPRRFRRP